MSVETWSERTEAAPAQGARGRPLVAGRLRTRLGPADLAVSLWRSKLLMFLVFLPIMLVGVGVALLFPAHYTASTRLLVRLGQEYVFDPFLGDAAKGAFPQQEEVLQAESELAMSPVIAERVIASIGMDRIYPQLARAAGRASGARAYAVEQRALELFAKDLDVSSAPKSSILRMAFAHRDPQTAADTLNAFVAAYLDYRRDVLTGQGAEGLSEQRRVIEGRLAAAESALQAFLKANDISDFDAANAALTKLYVDISDKLSEVEASLSEVRAKSAGLTRQLARTPSEIELYNETSSQQELFSLKLQRDELLTRYRPDSRAVQELDRRIAQMEQFLDRDEPGGLRRVGQNPTWQAMETDQAKAQADAAALAGRAEDLRRQKAEVEARRTVLTALEPEYRRLRRDRDALDASAAAFATREQTERSRHELASRSVDNISIYEPARAPVRGASPKRAIAAAAAIFGLMTALMVGLLRAWSLRTFPTAASLERTLGLTVLASTRERGPG